MTPDKVVQTTPSGHCSIALILVDIVGQVSVLGRSFVVQSYTRAHDSPLLYGHRCCETSSVAAHSTGVISMTPSLVDRGMKVALIYDLQLLWYSRFRPHFEAVGY